MKKGAIFDMDGLMFDTERLWQEGWRILAARYGYQPDDDFARDISGTTGEIMEGVIHRYYPGLDPSMFIREERAYVKSRLEEGVPVKPGLQELLELLQQKGLKMAVASSSRMEMIVENLRRTGMTDYFEAVVSGHQVRSAKPKPDIFVFAAGRIGLSPLDCYVLEDSFGGVRAGHASGAFTIMVPDQLQPTEEIRLLADCICVDLHEVAERIGQGDF